MNGFRFTYEALAEGADRDALATLSASLEGLAAAGFLTWWQARAGGGEAEIQVDLSDRPLGAVTVYSVVSGAVAKLRDDGVLTPGWLHAG